MALVCVRIAEGYRVLAAETFVFKARSVVQTIQVRKPPRFEMNGAKIGIPISRLPMNQRTDCSARQFVVSTSHTSISAETWPDSKSERLRDRASGKTLPIRERIIGKKNGFKGCCLEPQISEQSLLARWVHRPPVLF